MVEFFGDVVGKFVCGKCGNRVYSWTKKCKKCHYDFVNDKIV